MNIQDLKREALRLLARVKADDLAERVVLEYNPRMRTRAGACTYRRIRHDHAPRQFLIELNPTLLLERHPEALLPTLAHELAHAVVRVRHGGRVRVHGEEWKAVMRRMGHSPDRCHDLNVDGLQRRRDGESRWVCRRCRQVVNLGPIQTRREQRRRGTYTCLCGGGLAPKPDNYQQVLF